MRSKFNNEKLFININSLLFRDLLYEEIVKLNQDIENKEEDLERVKLINYYINYIIIISNIL